MTVTRWGMEALPHHAVVKDVLGSWLELQEGMTLGILMISRGMPICMLSVLVLPVSFDDE